MFHHQKLYSCLLLSCTISLWLSYVPWLTAITSWLLSNSRVESSIDRTSHPINNGAYNKINQECHQPTNPMRIEWKGSSLNDTLANAQMLKWDRYSSFVMPPFPTSSMSGSGSTTIIYKIHQGINKNQKLNRIWFHFLLTVPTTRASMRSPFVILICSRCHASEKEKKEEWVLIFVEFPVGSSCNELLISQIILPTPIVLNVSCGSPTVSYILGPCCRIFLSPTFFLFFYRNLKFPFQIDHSKKQSYHTLLKKLWPTIHTRRKIFFFLTWVKPYSWHCTCTSLVNLNHQLL